MTNPRLCWIAVLAAFAAAVASAPYPPSNQAHPLFGLIVACTALVAIAVLTVDP